MNNLPQESVAVPDVHPLIVDKKAPEMVLLRKRNRSERRFRVMGGLAICFALLFLAVLLTSIITSALPAFRTTDILVDIHYDASVLGSDVAAITPTQMEERLFDGLKKRFGDMPLGGRAGRKAIDDLISERAPYDLLKRIQAQPELLGHHEQIWVQAGSLADMAFKGTIPLHDASNKQISPLFRDMLQSLARDTLLRVRWNVAFWQQADSREPEDAGVWGALTGSFFVICVCMAVALPLGVMAAIYLEEFAGRGRFYDVVEINLNNLAAVPSIVYGLLALTVFLHGFDLPRSSSLVGGLALSLLVLPVIIIATRQALQSVPQSLRDAAIALGASPLQVAFHHTLPAALPGIMTGAILAVSRALGETAPLLMIGMVAFISVAPDNLLQPATALPVQVYLWSDHPEIGFREKTSAAILTLLLLLAATNMLAVYLRNRFQQKW
jgi:phosphate transport system permease protein